MAGPRRSGSSGRGKSWQIALSGIFTALAIVILLLGGLLPIATFTAPVLAGLCLVPVAIELGGKFALLAYAAISVLSFLMVPDRELVLFFILLTGYYPLLQPVLGRIKNKLLRWVPKLLLFNASVVAVYSLMLFLFTSQALRQELAGRAWWFWALLLVVGNLVFILYDVLLDRVRFVYLHHFRKKLFR